MEVHHSSIEGKKGFKEYLLEFFMIFLAVTLGFFAESLREHLGERGKEKEYMVSFISDLRHDTTELTSIIKFDSIKNTGIDTILNLHKKVLPYSNDLRELFYYDLKYIENISLFKGTDAVIQQLKSSGNLRLIHNQLIADSIITYDVAVKDSYGQAEICKSLFNDLNNLQLSYFDFTQITGARNYNLDSILQIKNPVLKHSKDILDIYFNKVYAYQATNKYYYKVVLKNLLAFTKRMIFLINKEYNISS